MFVIYLRHVKQWYILTLSLPSSPPPSGNTGTFASTAVSRQAALGLRIIEMRMRDCVNNTEMWHRYVPHDSNVLCLGAACVCVRYQILSSHRAPLTTILTHICAHTYAVAVRRLMNRTRKAGGACSPRCASERGR